MGVCNTKEYDEKFGETKLSRFSCDTGASERSSIFNKTDITPAELQRQRMETFYSNVVDILSILSDNVSSEARSEVYQSTIINTNIDQKRQDPVWREFIRRKTRNKSTKADIWLRTVFDIEE